MKKITTLGLISFRFLILIAASGISMAANVNPVYLAQGWDDKTRQQMYYTSFGSRFIPYDWFLVLEQTGSTELLRSPEHMTALGFVPGAISELNPDGLPVGLVSDSDKQQGDYLGLTCTACHTGQVSVQGQTIYIDGSQALIDFTRFEHSVLDSLKSTVADTEKFSRFFLSIIEKNPSVTADSLKQKMTTRITELEQRFTANATDVPYGKDRLDAFGQIFNAIAVEALHLPENARAPDAPASYPVLWDASHLDLVQWNASAPNQEPGPLFQNAITVLAVYGTVSVPKNTLTYHSSIRISNLGDLQSGFYKLTAPKWPVEYAGQLDAEKIARGKSLYEQHCAQCHTYVDASDAKRKLRAVLTPVADVGTDPLIVDNFADRRVKAGVLEGDRVLLVAGDTFSTEAKPIDLVTHTAAGALVNQPWQSLKAIIKEHESRYPRQEQQNDRVYKARPINGVWASAPYLHNGSVPTIYDLLLPAAQRPAIFYVGNIELDVVKVGYLTTETPNTTLFNTHLRGNSNAGHEYGTQLNDVQRWDLVEYIKSI